LAAGTFVLAWVTVKTNSTARRHDDEKRAEDRVRDDLRPVYHRLEERIRAHVILCWLALLLIRIIETTNGDTWNNVRRYLDRLHVGTFTGPAGTFRQRTELTKPQRDLLAKLAITPPKQIVELEPA
jgi:hypothetical protein